MRVHQVTTCKISQTLRTKKMTPNKKTKHKSKPVERHHAPGIFIVAEDRVAAGRRLRAVIDDAAMLAYEAKIHALNEGLKKQVMLDALRALPPLACSGQNASLHGSIGGAG